MNIQFSTLLEIVGIEVNIAWLSLHTLHCYSYIECAENNSNLIPVIPVKLLLDIRFGRYIHGHS